MLLSNYTNSRINTLNKLSIPEINEPFPIKVLWFRAISFGEKSSFISKKMHLHTFFEVHMIINGMMEYSSKDGQHYILEAGKGLLIAPDTEHIVNYYSNNFIKFGLAFMVDEDSEFYQNLKQCGICTFDLTEKILSDIDSVLEETDLSTSFSLTLIRNRMLDIICNISRTVGVYEYCSPVNMTVEDKRVTAARLYIHDNKNKALSSNEVAAQCGLSPKQMNRLFFAATGKNLHEYIDIVKIKEAENLLSSTSLPIKEISELLGFSSVYYFNRFFSKSTGIPPAYFRNLSAK